MNEEIVEEVSDAAKGMTVIEAGKSATETVVEGAKPFIDWLTKFCTWDNLFKIIGAVVFLFIIWAVCKLCVKYVKKIPAEKLSPQRSMILTKAIKYLCYFLMFGYILSLFGIKLSAIWGAAGVAGVALAFAAQTSVSNVISGIFILAEKTMRVGDLVTINGDTGIVDSVELLCVKIRTLDNQMIRIPNSTIINSNMRNTSYFEQRRMSIEVSVSYDTDLDKALKVLATAPALCPAVLKDPAPLVWYDKFDASGINLTLAVWFKSADFLDCKNQAYVAVKKVFNDAKIEIPYTKIDINMINESAASGKKAAAKIVKKPAAKKTAKK